MMTGPAIASFTRMLARRDVLIGIRQAGHKQRAYSAADIHRLTDDYVMAHRGELIEEAKALCEQLHARMVARRELLRQRRASAKLLTDARAKGACSTTIIPVQISGAK
jgi:hypothetical protein